MKGLKGHKPKSGKGKETPNGPKAQMGKIPNRDKPKIH